MPPYLYQEPADWRLKLVFFHLQAIDYWMLVCLFFIFLAQIEFVIAKILDVMYRYEKTGTYYGQGFFSKSADGGFAHREVRAKCFCFTINQRWRNLYFILSFSKSVCFLETNGLIIFQDSNQTLRQLHLEISIHDKNCHINIVYHYNITNYIYFYLTLTILFYPIVSYHTLLLYSIQLYSFLTLTIVLCYIYQCASTYSSE